MTHALPTMYLDSPESVRIAYDPDELYFPYTLVIQGTTSLAEDALTSQQGPLLHVEASFTASEMDRLLKSVKK